MRRGAKSKRLEHPASAFKALAGRLWADAAIASWHKVGLLEHGTLGLAFV
jgi:hypothetical protein